MRNSDKRWCSTFDMYSVPWIRPHVIRYSLFIFFSVLLIVSCKKGDEPIPPKPLPKLAEVSVDVATQWADMTLYVIRYSAFNTPTYSSRSLGYLGLCMYETIVPGDATHHSLSGQLN